MCHPANVKANVTKKEKIKEERQREVWEETERGKKESAHTRAHQRERENARTRE